MQESIEVDGRIETKITMTVKDVCICMAALRNLKSCLHECVGIMDGGYKDNTQRMLDDIDSIGSKLSNAVQEVVK